MSTVYHVFLPPPSLAPLPLSTPFSENSTIGLYEIYSSSHQNLSQASLPITQAKNVRTASEVQSFDSHNQTSTSEHGQRKLGIGRKRKGSFRHEANEDTEEGNFTDNMTRAGPSKHAPNEYSAVVLTRHTRRITRTTGLSVILSFQSP